MKASTINQINMYAMMLSGRYGEGEYFLGAEISLKSGTKVFPADISHSDNGLMLTFGGGTRPFGWSDLSTLAKDYDAMTLTYRERGTNAILTADDRGASLRYEDSGAASAADKAEHASTATVGAREYLIAPPKANALLK